MTINLKRENGMYILRVDKGKVEFFSLKGVFHFINALLMDNNK